MCGIVGYIGDTSTGKINKMLSAISHRGPDDHGVYVNKQYGLGNNRLSVIDLSKNGHQPMFDNEKTICIVYNGEMYNFKNLRNELKKEFKFKSETDTEAIIYAYKKWGVDCLTHLNGMFAFVIYDIKKNLLFGARDRLGEKPLKYYLDGNKFIFASEIKAILQVLETKPEMDYQAVSDYLTLQYIPAPRTGFKNIYKLPPASYFIYKNGKLKISKYWNLDFKNKTSMQEDEVVNQLDACVSESVKNCMVSDVSLGAFLSGGIDSSAVVAYMAKNSNKRISTFSIGIKNSDFDESGFANSVAKLYKTNHSTLMVDSKMFLNTIEKCCDYYDEPFADNSMIPTLLLSKFTRNKITVALSGDGGDELFAGYDRYNIVRFGEYYSYIPKGLRNSLVKPIANEIFNIIPSLLASRIVIFAKTFDRKFYDKYTYYKSFFNHEDKIKILKDKRYADAKYYMSGFNSKYTPIDNSLSMDIASYLPEDLLFKTDIASMSASLEVRAPLLDYGLMEFAAKIPDRLKIKNFNKKYIFKKMLLEKNILPKSIIDRKKQGFVMPIGEWLKNDLKNYTIETLSSKKFRNAGIFNDKKLDSYIDNYYPNDLKYHNNMFALLSLSNWINKYF